MEATISSQAVAVVVAAVVLRDLHQWVLEWDLEAEAVLGALEASEVSEAMDLGSLDSCLLGIRDLHHQEGMDFLPDDVVDHL